jgi:hypothetical protein
MTLRSWPRACRVAGLTDFCTPWLAARSLISEGPHQRYRPCYRQWARLTRTVVVRVACTRAAHLVRLPLSRSLALCFRAVGAQARDATPLRTTNRQKPATPEPFTQIRATLKGTRMQKSLGLVGLMVMCACGGDDPYKPEFSARSATAAECASGGSVFLVDGKEQMSVCNGADGKNGARGADGSDGVDGENGQQGLPGQRGATGASGVAGTPGPAQVVAESAFCSATRDAPFLAVNYQFVRMSDGSLFVDISCDTATDEDSDSNFYTSLQTGATTGAVDCSLMDDAVVVNVAAAVDFSARSFSFTENGNSLFFSGTLAAECTLSDP